MSSLSRPQCKPHDSIQLLLLSAETIDYGPYGFLERFDPAFTPNTSDLDGRRYSFKQQPQMCYWNCLQFATALVQAELVNKVSLLAWLLRAQ